MKTNANLDMLRMNPCIFCYVEDFEEGVVFVKVEPNDIFGTMDCESIVIFLMNDLKKLQYSSVHLFSD